MENDIQLKTIESQVVMDSRDVAKEIGKRHRDLMRDIRRYINDLATSAKLRPLDFFIEASYEDDKGETRPCFLLTKQGCEFVGNKMTGKKGTLFTARYVSLFNEYQEEHQKKQIGASGMTPAQIDQNLEIRKTYNRELHFQNMNKAKENQIADVKTKLEISKWAHKLGFDEAAIDWANDAIDTALSLPVGQGSEYTASEIGDRMGASAYLIGKYGQILGIKGDPLLSRRVGKDSWRYTLDGFKTFEEHREEIIADYNRKHLKED